MVSTIIVAGGSGTRVGGATPKQFLEIGGEPILVRTLRNFEYLGGEIIVVLPAGQVDQWRNICIACNVTTPHKVTTGGSDRFSSVAAGLSEVSLSASVILVQDGVRPLASRALIDRVVSGARLHGAVVPAIGVTDTILTLSGEVVDRTQLLAVQTPQGFSRNILTDSYAAATTTTSFTDDASVVRSSGRTVRVVEGERENIKITTPLDLKIAKILW